MKSFSPLAVAAVLALSACSDMTQQQQRTLSGAAIGTVGGAAIGAIAGNAGLGAVLGAGAGAAGGYIFDQHKQAQDRAFQQGYTAGQTSRPH